MADGTEPMDVSSSDPCVFRPDLSPHSILELAYNAGFTKHFVIIINSISGIIPRTYPIKLKKELAASVSNPKLIESLTYTKSNKIICSTSDFKTATELLTIKKLLSCQTQAEIITENLTSKFILYNVPVGISSKDIADELCSENDISVYEVRRFQKKVKVNALRDQANMLVSMFTACTTPAGLVPLSSSSPRSEDIPKDSDCSKSPDKKKHASDKTLSTYYS
ncbi:hypothetical protein JTE90_016755 [Oedothorax gibbosus]|uniref:Uncharacterized protein n=1 Tax=Oedothorax gibbosus TaxID=931172 RepID=A0AAV6VWU3_9ARAC|nr:hypothetical protein JTE90_016755 [Oedothorax gibbosus]